LVLCHCQGNTPLHVAAEAGDPRTLTLLLESAAQASNDTNIQEDDEDDDDDNYSLAVALPRGGQMISLLLPASADGVGVTCHTGEPG
jgi:ankyrin repeat protein